MTPAAVMTLIVFVMIASGTLFVFALVGAKRTRLDNRLEDLSGNEIEIPESKDFRQVASVELGKVGKALIPADDKERTALQTRLYQAGYYGRHAMSVFLGVKLLLIAAPSLIGLLLGFAGLVPLNYGLIAGACLGVIGLIGPSFWLDTKKKARQKQFRRALPDALDVIVICLEGGMSLQSALKRVTAELRMAHPVLAAELLIVEREIQLGRTPGESLHQMGVRCDLEDVRSLASVITQAERFGAGLVKSLRVHAETLRVRRKQHAEELAQKASIKILIPTLLLIFPAVFVVILGPAAIQITKFLDEINRK